MKIGELADRAGVAPRMLRYYEQQGLLAARRSDNGYRDYDESDVGRAQRIRSLIRAGVPTRLIGPILQMEGRDPSWTDGCTADLASELTDELHAIRERIACLTMSEGSITEYLVRTGHAVEVDRPTSAPGRVG
jgi:DNA-binding transcriptional MerR regulator